MIRRHMMKMMKDVLVTAKIDGKCRPEFVAEKVDDHAEYRCALRNNEGEE